MQIEPCKLAHLRAIIPRLRKDELTEFAAMGEVPRHALFRLWGRTTDPRAAILNGEAIAAWGDEMPPLSREGVVWFVTTGAVEAIPVAFVKTARAEIIRMLGYRQVLRSAVHLSCVRALRFYRHLGFELIEGTMREGFVEIRISRWQNTWIP